MCRHIYPLMYSLGNQFLSVCFREKKCLRNYHLKGLRSACPRCPNTISSSMRGVPKEQAGFYGRRGLYDRNLRWQLSQNHSANRSLEKQSWIDSSWL